MTIIAMWLKSKIMGNGLTWIFIGIIAVILLVIIIPNLDQIRERLGFETRTSLKVLTIEQAQVIETVQASNTSMSMALEATDAIKGVTEKAMVQQSLDSETAEQHVITTITTKRDHIRKVHTSHPTDLHARAAAVSRVQITAIWDTYCTYNACTQGAPT